MSLPVGYEIRVLTNEEFFPLFAKWRTEMFAETSLFQYREALSNSEVSALSELHKRMQQTYSLNLGLYFHGEFAGWSFGRQESAEKFYMANSAILPDHRRKGLYTALMTEMVKQVGEAGFQIIYSRHTAVNNAILMAKMKAGFVLTAMELSDAFGLLVHLSHFTNPIRRKVLEFRAGERLPDDEIRKFMKLT